MFQEPRQTSLHQALNTAFSFRRRAYLRVPSAVFFGMSPICGVSFNDGYRTRGDAGPTGTGAFSQLEAVSK